MPFGWIDEATKDADEVSEPEPEATQYGADEAEMSTKIFMDALQGVKKTWVGSADEATNATAQAYENSFRIGRLIRLWLCLYRLMVRKRLYRKAYKLAKWLVWKARRACRGRSWRRCKRARSRARYWRGSRGCYWSRWRRCRNWAVRAIRQGVRAAWDARHELSAAIGLDHITSTNSHIHKTAKHIAKETQKALKNADKLITNTYKKILPKVSIPKIRWIDEATKDADEASEPEPEPTQYVADEATNANVQAARRGRRNSKRAARRAKRRAKRASRRACQHATRMSIRAVSAVRNAFENAQRAVRKVMREAREAMREAKRE